jgi:hypothetical protein
MRSQFAREEDCKEVACAPSVGFTLASMQTDPSRFSRKRTASNMLGRNAATCIPPVTTDADGRFSLAGFGRERFVRLDILAPPVASLMRSGARRPLFGLLTLEQHRWMIN